MSKKTSLLQKIFLFLLAVFLSLAIVETVLQIGGRIFLWRQEAKNRQILKGSGDVITVMCVGESTTALGGEDSYPSQLETILNDRSHGTRFKVINKGVPMTNTGIMAEEIGPWVESYDPDLVVFMIGINDHNPLIPVDLYGVREHPIWNRFQTYKLIKWLVKNWYYQNRQADLQKDNISAQKLSWEKTKKAIHEKRHLSGLIQIAESTSNRELARFILDRLKELAAWVPDNEDMYAFIGGVLLQNKWYPEVTEVMDYFLERSHHHRWLYDHIAVGCRNSGLRQAVIGHLLEKISRNPDQWPLIEFLGTCYAESGQMELAQQQFNRARELRRQTVDPLTRQNYIRIVRTLQKQGVPFILVQYPMRDVQTLKFLFDGLNGVEGFVFVDNEKLFQDKVAQNGYDAYFTDRFAGDFGHCTRQGNYLLANNIAQAILDFVSVRQEG